MAHYRVCAFSDRSDYWVEGPFDECHNKSVMCDIGLRFPTKSAAEAHIASEKARNAANAALAEQYEQAYVTGTSDPYDLARAAVRKLLEDNGGRMPEWQFRAQAAASELNLNPSIANQDYFVYEGEARLN